jgi:hypothetical protein
MAYELLHSLDKKVIEHNIALKLDMTKAFDRVCWLSLLEVMKRFSFSPYVLNLVENCLNNCWFSVLVNDESCVYFKSVKGLRQWDLLSSALFILSQELLSRPSIEFQDGTRSFFAI